MISLLVKFVIPLVQEKNHVLSTWFKEVNNATEKMGQFLFISFTIVQLSFAVLYEIIYLRILQTQTIKRVKSSFEINNIPLKLQLDIVVFAAIQILG